ncbi:hypothetical protein M9H77_08490 [Catharanthus roseus]|uniref:Uncharacterized protein n=1 Tax=Catharanthus roseus TaxID=4058 RepID=A0ACC0BY12_CATRO|nr:hypothetical protein M9H77_08490 [Catharanthus roseus]
MATTDHHLALIIKNPSNDKEFLLLKQTPPPKFNDPEYDSYVDSDLWDLPSTQLSRLLEPQLSHSQVPIPSNEFSCSDKFNLSHFDFSSALTLALEHIEFGITSDIKWEFLKSVREPDFGPGLPMTTVYLIAKLAPEDGKLKGLCKWMTIENCLDMILQMLPGNDRFGPLVVLGLLNDALQSENRNVTANLPFQEYPPGVKLIPMVSRTAKPFRTTNLVVFAPGSANSCGDDSFVAQADALIVDPGCSSALHKELEEIIDALPKKLAVFVTHHHPDHVDGLSVVQKCNPDSILLANKNTMSRVGRDDWSLGYISVSDFDEICIGDQRLRIISAPGHTDGHMSLLHVSTNSLIVGDHCVGQGSAVLDITSGGNMGEYFQTTYRFMELSPHILIPMHGRVNVWPKHMLCSYLKNRRNRESTILKAIEDGAKTLFDIVSYTYADVDPSVWIPAASNVRLHVDHLAQQDKLPKEFSVQKFNSSCRLQFFSRWLWAYVSSTFMTKPHILRAGELFGATAVVTFTVFYCVRNKLQS